MKLLDMIWNLLFGRRQAALHRRAAAVRTVNTEALLKTNRAILDDLHRMEEEVRGSR